MLVGTVLQGAPKMTAHQKNPEVVAVANDNLQKF